ncbi:MAG: DMT family transporter [Fimbriiglobus sp.]|jgi:transporter family-2 protein|nr:DMT family transporter [Fimbriiglobus sp.]
MNWTTTLYVGLAAAAGSCIALQASANGKFRQNLAAGAADSAPDYLGPAWASYFSICGTILCATVAMLVIRPPLPTREAFQSTQWWNWIGGPLGALIVLAGATLTPRLGAAVFIAAVVGGQILSSMLLDHFGLMGLPQQPLSVGRVVGAVLVVGGVACVKWL